MKKSDFVLLISIHYYRATHSKLAKDWLKYNYKIFETFYRHATEEAFYRKFTSLENMMQILEILEVFMRYYESNPWSEDILEDDYTLLTQ